jgi:hypothetical protein
VAKQVDAGENLTFPARGALFRVAVYVSGINVTMTDLGGYSGAMTDASSRV